MSESKGYNGWTNYETWTINLFVTNEQPSAEYWEERAKECYRQCSADATFTRAERATYALSEEIKAEFEEGSPLPDDTSVYAQLLSSALSEVDWHEIAEHMIEDLDKDAIDAEDAEDESEEDDDSE